MGCKPKWSKGSVYLYRSIAKIFERRVLVALSGGVYKQEGNSAISQKEVVLWQRRVSQGICLNIILKNKKDVRKNNIFLIFQDYGEGIMLAIVLDSL